jgi:outer membrane protein OmpA-like peptidoglycan-associated protein
MKQYFFLFFLLSLWGMCFGGDNPKKQVPKPGDKIIESILYYKDSVNNEKYNLPNNAFTLMYRFGELNGKKDNYDSLYAVVNHVYRLNRYFGPRRKPSRLTCYVFVKKVDEEALALKKKINAWSAAIGDSLVKTERAGFNFNRPWQVIFITDKEIKPMSILGANKLSVIAAEGTLLYSSPIQAFKFNGKKGSIKGKLLTEKEGKKLPIPNVMVSIFRIGKNEPDSALTDAYGDFELDVPDENTEYSIFVRSQAHDVDNVILATQGGQEISRLKKTERGFEYKLIPTDVSLLTEKESEDISLIFSKFGGSKETDMKVSENILYALGQYKIEDAGSKQILDKVVKILKENPKVKLEVISHTDAQGDDASNMALSEKRSNSVVNYFILKGVNKNRLKAIGKGETEILNRCTNGVDCSDMEHEYNRRTEFKFTKS